MGFLLCVHNIKGAVLVERQKKMDEQKATIIFFLVIIAFLVMGIYVERDEGYKKGYQEGYDSGYDLGYEDGYTSCLNDYEIE